MILFVNNSFLRDKAAKSSIYEMKDSEYYSITGIVYFCVFFVAFWIEDLGYVMAFLGTTTAILLSYILPAVFYLKLSKDDPNPGLKAVSWVLITLGVGFFILCTYHFLAHAIVPLLTG